MSLRDRCIRPVKSYKLQNGDELMLLVQPHGSRLWRRLRVHRTETMFAIGRFTDVTLAAEAAREMFKLAQQRIKSSNRQNASKALTVTARASSFRVLIVKWLDKRATDLTSATLRQRKMGFGLMGWIGQCMKLQPA